MERIQTYGEVLVPKVLILLLQNKRDTPTTLSPLIKAPMEEKRKSQSNEPSYYPVLPPRYPTPSSPFMSC